MCIARIIVNRSSSALEISQELIMITTLLRCVVIINGKSNTPKEVLLRSKMNFNLKGYRRYISNIGWSDVMSTSNVNVAYFLFDSKILKILNKWAPIKKVQVRKKYINWLIDATKDLIGGNWQELYHCIKVKVQTD